MENKPIFKVGDIIQIDMYPWKEIQQVISIKNDIYKTIIIYREDGYYNNTEEEWYDGELRGKKITHEQLTELKAQWL